MQRIKWYLLTVLLVLGCISPNSYSQGIITGGISGTVVDPAGAIIPGALAKVVSESTGTSFQVLTNNEGAFQIADVPLGSYSVSITAAASARQP